MNVSLDIITLLFALSNVFNVMTDAFVTMNTLKEKERDRPDLVDSINYFSWNLMSGMASDQPTANLLLSPISISSVLLMLWSGATGNTKTELEQVCGFRQGSLKDFHKIQLSLLHSETSEERNATMIISNAIFHNKDIQRQHKFLSDANEYFQADFKEIDFKQMPNNAKSTINEWVKNRTHGFIEEIISSELGPETALVITNAVYFKGKWKYPFETAATTDTYFRISNGKTVKVPMMRRKGRFAHMKVCRLPKGPFKICSLTSQPDVVEIPYEDGKHVMIVLIPNEFYSLKRIEDEFSQRYRLWRRGIVKGDEVQLSLPKFNVEFESKLNDRLEKSGLKTAFNSLANFNGMTKTPIAVSQFVHKTAIEIDEGGTTAAASSSAIAVLRMKDIENIVVDRSFYFFIEDIETRSHLFAGKIVDPTERATVLN